MEIQKFQAIHSAAQNKFQVELLSAIGFFVSLREKDRQTEIEKQTDTHTERQTDRQTHRETDREKNSN